MYSLKQLYPWDALTYMCCWQIGYLHSLICLRCAVFYNAWLKFHRRILHLYMLEGNVNISILLSGLDERSVCNCLLNLTMSLNKCQNFLWCYKHVLMINLSIIKKTVNLFCWSLEAEWLADWCYVSPFFLLLSFLPFLFLYSECLWSWKH